MKNKELDKKLDDIIEKLETILSIEEKAKPKNESENNGLHRFYNGPSIPPRNIQEA